MRWLEAERIVAPILEDVRKRGDDALFEYARKFDGLDNHDVRVSPRISPPPAHGRARFSRRHGDRGSEHP